MGVCSLSYSQVPCVRLNAPATTRRPSQTRASLGRRTLRVAAAKNTTDVAVEVDKALKPPKPVTKGPAQCKTANCPLPPPPLNEWPPQRSFAETALGKVGDTLGDVGLITRRTLFPVATELDEIGETGPTGGRLQFESRRSRPVILVLGSGWAAHAFMKARHAAAFVCPPPH